MFQRRSVTGVIISGNIFPCGRKRLTSLAVLAALCLLPCVQSIQAQPRLISPAQAGMSQPRLAAIEPIVKSGLNAGNMPGCVVLVGRKAGIVYHRAFGYRRLLPEREPMQLDTVFDLASLTKPLATATSIHLLASAGKLNYSDRAVEHLPTFAGQGKEEITIHQLLTHTSGLIPDNALADYTSGREAAFERIDSLSLRAEPGQRFMYSDVGFIVLGRIVTQLSAKSLDQFTQTEIFEPLGMSETMFNPSAPLQQKAAVTQQRNDQWMQGEVHDPRAYELGGVAGHAGLFSTATDLARYSTAVLEAAAGQSTPVFNQKMVNTFCKPQTVPGGLRTLGWDSQSGYSSNRGDLLSKTACGHGGFTGTALWIDPQQDLYIVFLSNRVHPNGKGSVNRLAGRIATVAAAAICCD